jgi:membrane protein
VKRKCLQLWQYARAFAQRTTACHTGAFASKAALFLFLSLFPLAMLLFALVPYLPFSKEQLISFLSGLFPASSTVFVDDQVSVLYDQNGAVLWATVLTTLWAASKGFVALIQGLDTVYQVKERRRYPVLRLTSILFTLLLLIFLVAALGILVFGNHLANQLMRLLPQLRAVTWGILDWRNLVGGGLLVIFFLLLYRLLPRRKSTLWAELPGALVSAVGWLVFSRLFSFYIEHFGNYANIYGSLTAVAVLILWLYACIYILLLGAQLNVMLQSGELPTPPFLKRKTKPLPPAK